MNKDAFVDVVKGHLSESYEQATKADASNAIDAVTAAIMDVIRQGDEINFVGFGKFSVQHKAAREALVFGEMKTMPAKTVPKFTPATAMKQAADA